MSEWVRTYESDNDYMESLGGVVWYDAPLPYPWHKCTVQTRGWLGLNYAERCACGAIRFSARDPWTERNQTRKAQARERRQARLPRAQVTCRECGQPYEAATGTRAADQQMCDECWAAMFVASGGKRY